MARISIDNVIFHPTKPRILAVLDWKLSTLGDPLVDFAYHCLLWRLGANEGRSLAGAYLAALGIPDETQYRAAYLARMAQATGREQRVPMPTGPATSSSTCSAWWASCRA